MDRTSTTDTEFDAALATYVAVRRQSHPIRRLPHIRTAQKLQVRQRVRVERAIQSTVNHQSFSVGSDRHTVGLIPAHQEWSLPRGEIRDAFWP
jgi:hypothetical protein